jgi:hypothetical protein
MRIMVLHLKLKKFLAFFASAGLSDGSRYLVGFFVPKLNDELPFSTERILGHACILYGLCSETQDIVANKVVVGDTSTRFNVIEPNMRLDRPSCGLTLK